MIVAKYGAVWKVTLLGSLVYRGDVLIRSISMGMILFVFVQLWTTTFTLGAFQTIAGFDLRDLLWYLVITEVAVLSAGSQGISQRIDQDVKSGELARVLVRPYSYVAYQFATSCGETAVRLPLQALLGGLVVWLAVGPPPAGPLAFVGAAVALALSLTLSFLIAAGIGLLAFWCEETLPFYWIYQKLVFTLGGLFLPLELLPSPLADVAGKLPFASIAYAPGRIFVGSSPEVALTQLGSQLVWVGIALAAVTLIYRRGVRKLNVHGG